MEIRVSEIVSRSVNVTREYRTLDTLLRITELRFPAILHTLISQKMHKESRSVNKFST